MELLLCPSDLINTTVNHQAMSGGDDGNTGTEQQLAADIFTIRQCVECGHESIAPAERHSLLTIAVESSRIAAHRGDIQSMILEDFTLPPKHPNPEDLANADNKYMKRRSRQQHQGHNGSYRSDDEVM